MKILLPTKAELQRRLEKLIPADEIKREKPFYLEALMFFTDEELKEADERTLYKMLLLTMGVNLSEETQAKRRPIDIESIIDAIVGDNKALGDAVKAKFGSLAERYRQSK